MPSRMLVMLDLLSSITIMPFCLQSSLFAKPLTLELQKILYWNYEVAPITVDFISSLMDFFAIDKDSDIRLVYNGTSCGLNEALLALGFQSLPPPPKLSVMNTTWSILTWEKCS
jgi:hypothetical protein